MELSAKVLDGTRILCVDDNFGSLEVLRAILTRQGASVTTRSSAEEAIATLKAERFDVMVSDLSMPPGLDGYDLVHALRKMEDDEPARATTPAIVVSSSALQASRKRRFADFQVYMPKPVDKARLVYVIERLVEADGKAVALGSLGRWEAEQATAAAIVGAEVAADATAAAAEASSAAANAMAAAADATEAAANARLKSSDAEIKAMRASAMAPASF